MTASQLFENGILKSNNNNAVTRVKAISPPMFRALWLGAAIAVSTLCLLVTLFEQLVPTEGLGRRLHDFNLRGERGAGAWSSGMLLLLSAVHAFDGYFAKRERSTVEYAWGAIALLLALLSIDEV